MNNDKPYNDYVAGEVGPMGSPIKEIIIQNIEAIVYLDSADSIQWATYKYENFPESFGEIQNKVSYWESITNNLFSRKAAYDIKCLLAEAYARILDNRNITTAREIIEQCKERIIKHGCEILKQSYAIASLTATIVCLISILILRYNKNLILLNYSNDVYEILLTMAFGGIGSYMFATIRLKNYVPEIVLSKHIHQLDGILRVFYGIIAGLIVAIAIKSNIIFGFLNDIERTIYVSVFLGTIAGASEAFIPNLIKQVESKTFDNK